MTQPISLRDYVESDRPDLERLVGWMYDFESGITPGRQRWDECRDDFRKWFDEQMKSGDGFAFVAVRDGKIVGVCVGHVEEVNYPALKPADRRRGCVDELVVDESQRRQGIGTTLWNAAADFCRARGYIRLRVMTLSDNRDAQKFYQSIAGLSPYLITYRQELTPTPI